MILLAENGASMNEALALFYGFIFCVIVLLVGLVSFIFSAFGHKLGIIFAAPCAVIGLWMFVEMLLFPARTDGVAPLFPFCGPVLLMAGLSSSALWAYRYISKKKRVVNEIKASDSENST